MSHAPHRKRLPAEREAVTHRFSIGGQKGYVIVGLFEDGHPGEIFLKIAKEGSTLSGFASAFSTCASLALQYGVPLKVLVRKFRDTAFEPDGFTGNQQIPHAASVLDYVFRWLERKFILGEEVH